ncbi:MAG TPA: general stress protein CsbD [Chitinophagaceae bacterium]
MPRNLKLERPWTEVKEMLKEANVDLTDEDLVYQPGEAEKLLTRLGSKMHRSKDEIRAWIESASYTDGKAS